jgi:hypothetical protein
MAELTRRYVVMVMADEAPFDPADPEGVFVLKPWKDPAAVRALETYRDNCYPELARDLDAWIVAIAAGPPALRGDVGRRNEPHLRAAPAASTDQGPSRPRAKPARPARSGKPSARRATRKRKKRSR